MSKLTDRVSYLKGLAAGMKLNMEKDSHRLILEILDALGDITEEMEQMTNAHNELSEYVESIDDDLADLEETLFDDDDEALAEDDEDGYEHDDDCDCDDCRDEDDENEEDEDPEEEMDEDEVISYACPHCGRELQFKASSVDFDEDYRCPACGKPVFPELLEDEDKE